MKKDDEKRTNRSSIGNSGLCQKKQLGLVMVLIMSLLVPYPLWSQEKETQTDKSYELYGFVRTDFFAQNRNTKTSVLDLFPLYPMPRNLFQDKDLNNYATAGLSSISTRIGLNFYAPGIWGAQKTYANIETDFSGSSDFILLRIRKAYMQFFWEKSHLIIGQTWHPLFTEAMMPNLISLNTGAPYNPFNRSPQIRYTQFITPSISLMGAAVYQVMNKSDGPNGMSIQYQKDALVPNMYLGTEIRHSHLMYGLGIDYKAINPERTIVKNGVPQINKQLLHTFSGTAFVRYTKDKFLAQAKAVYGQNLVDHSIIGGYVITEDHEYFAFNSMSSFVNLSYGKRHQIGLFYGYTANYGADKSSMGIKSFSYYGFGVENGYGSEFGTENKSYIKDMHRMVLTYTYNPNNWRIGAELAYDNAMWGHMASQWRIDAVKRTDALRLHAIVMYLF